MNIIFKSKKGFITVVVVVLISVMAIGLVGAAWYYEANKDEACLNTNTKTAITNSNSNQNVNSTTNMNTNASTSDTPDWQTYMNEEYNYSFQYPDGWTITRENEDVGNELEFNTTLQSNDYKEVVTDNGFIVDLTSGAKINIWTHNDSTIKTIDELVDFYNLGSGSHFKLTEDYITIDNRLALHHTLDDYNTGIIEDAHFIYKDVWYTITVYHDVINSSYVGLFDQILSTFQFTN